MSSRIFLFLYHLIILDTALFILLKTEIISLIALKHLRVVASSIDCRIMVESQLVFIWPLLTLDLLSIYLIYELNMSYIRD